MLPLYHLPSDTKTIQHSHNDREIAVLELPHLKRGLSFILMYTILLLPKYPKSLILYFLIGSFFCFFFTDFCLIFGYQSVSNFPQKPLQDYFEIQNHIIM